MNSAVNMPTRVQGKIDVHHHLYPDDFTQAIENWGGDSSGWFIPAWTVEADQALCQQMGVQTTILSYGTAPAEIDADPVAAQKLARRCNEISATIRDAQPDAYGFFAAVPSLIHSAAALEEIAYAFDILHADGVCLMTRYGDDNHYLGHPDFTEIWDFLDSRSAVVFVHPTVPVDRQLINKVTPQPAWDYPHETGRTAIDMISTNMLRHHASNCKIILSHAGGTLPYLIDRYAGLMQGVPASFGAGKSRDEIITEAGMFYFDTALSSSHMNLTLLMELLGPERKDHVLFGTDFPNAPNAAIDYFTSQLEKNTSVNAEDLRNNALKLFPRLQR